MKGSGEMKAEAEWEPFEHQVAGHFFGEEKVGRYVMFWTGTNTSNSSSLRIN